MSEKKVSLSGEMRNRLLEIRSQLQTFQLMRGGIQYCLVALLLLFGVGVFDFYFPLPLLVRSGLILLLTIVAFGCFVYWLKNRDQIDELTAARELEHANPDLGQRLRTSHQFDSTQTPEAPQLSSALIAQTNAITSQVDLANPIPWKSIRKWAFGFAVMAAAILCVVAYNTEARTTLARMLMMPIHYSSLSVTEMEPIVAGSNAQFSVNASGRPLKSVELWVRDAKDSEWTKVPMLPPGTDPESVPKALEGNLTATIEDCQDDLIYQIVASPLPTSGGRVKVLQPLEQQSFLATIEPPTYIGSEPETVEEMEFTVVEGSMVALQLQLNREPATAELISTSDNGNKVPLKIEGSLLSCDLAQLEDTKSYEIMAKSADGMKFNSDRIRVRVKKDQGPKVAIQKPKDELSVFATTEVGLNLRVSDDFGVSKVGIEYKINDGERKTLWEKDLKGEKKELTAAPVLYLEEHELSHEDAITYYAFAEDNRPDPKRTRSPLRFIDIQPYKREFQVVDANCKGGGSCNSLTLEELIKRQRHNLSRTFANLDRQPIQDSLCKRLTQSQREIQKATDEFTIGWEKEFGPMPSLHAASKSMTAAANELESKALDPAMPLEESALASLIKAKQNVRKYLKNCKSPGQFSQCKNFDTSMAQRIRQPEREEEAEDTQSMAETRQQIQDLAEQQKRFSEDVAAASGGAKLDKKPSQSQSGSKSSSQSKSGNQAKPSQQSMAKSQQSSAQKAQQMQRAIQKNEIASESAQQKMDEATQKIEESAKDLENGDQLAASEKAKQAAELLEQLDEHLKGLSGSDLTKRMAIAEQIASRLANAESQVAKALENNQSQQNSGPSSNVQSAGQQGSASQSNSDPSQTASSQQELANTQERLADQAETLADLLRHLEADALGEDPELRQGLGEIQDEMTPEDLASEMRELAKSIARKEGRAASGANSSANQLSQLASELGNLRRGAMQPRLDDLLAAEAQAAELLDKIKSDTSQSELNQKYEQLQNSLSELQISPPSQPSSIQPPVGQRGNAASSGSGGGKSEPKFFYAGRARNAELRDILNVLQSQIQDAILLTAKMDADEPIPAKYRELVNEYYQTLSDDLR